MALIPVFISLKDYYAEKDSPSPKFVQKNHFKPVNGPAGHYAAIHLQWRNQGNSRKILIVSPVKTCCQRIRLGAALVFLVTNASAQPTINSLYPPTLSERVGDHLAYSVSATASSGPLSYAWYQAGNPAVLSTSNALVLVNIQSTNAGSYYVVVTDNNGPRQSGNVTLNVLAAGSLPLYSTNLVVARVGDGAQTLSGATGNTLYLDQYATNGGYLDTIQIPDEGLGQPYGTGSSSSSGLPTGSSALLIAGSNVSPGNDAGYEAFLGRAPNGLSLSFGGYCQAYPFQGTDVSAEPGGNGGDDWRGIATVDAFGNYGLVWTNSGLYSGGNHQFHSAVDIDGNATNYYTAGEAGSINAVKYCNINFQPANGSGIAAVAGSLGGTRVAQVAGGNLIYSDVGVSPIGLYACAGVPQTTVTASLVIAETNQPMDFAFSPDLKTVYIADNGAFGGTNVPTGGVQRWDSNGGSGPDGFPGYSYSYTLQMGVGSTIGARALTVDFSAASTWGRGVTGAKIYVTTAETFGNRLLRILDNGAGSSATLLATAPANEMLCGVRFGPVFVTPSFSIQPQSQTITVGAMVTFSASAAGTGPLTYQWYFQLNGTGSFTAITNATNDTYTINSVESNNFGNYYVVATDPESISTQSQTASLSLPGTSSVTVAVDAQSPGLTIPTNFLGLSFETANLKYGGVGVNGYMFDSSNTELVTLFTNMGIKHLRIGGTSTDTNNGPVIPFYFPTNQDIDALFRFVKAAGVQAIVSLQMENANPAADGALGAYTWTNYNQYMTSLAIGNEPEAFGSADPAITNFSSYFSVWTNIENAVLNLAPGAKFEGVDGTETTWPHDFAEAETGSNNVVEITCHFYFGGSSVNLSAQQIVSGMLSSSWDASTYPSDFNATVPVAASYGFPYRTTEFNSYVAGYPGVAGGNNTFAAALFSCDAAHWWAANGSAGANFHTYLGKYNATVYYDANSNYQIFPIGYGEAAFALGSQGAVVPVTITNTNSLNLTAYGVISNNNLYVTIINKEYESNAQNASVTIIPEGISAGAVQAMYLTAPNGVYSTNDVTLGGASITNNAPFQPQWTPLGLLTNGQCVVAVPMSSAAIVLIQATFGSEPPTIVTNLPGLLRVAAGGSYTYSIAVTGVSPFNYQWYQGTNSIAGATNASYTATAGAAGSAASYSVVVTNIYGSATSVVSMLMSVAPPPLLTDYYSRQVMGYGPVGYWPLQETNATAPGNWETNYGTLGPLGNAYYACTNASNVAFDQPGALAGSADSCVVFSGGSSNPNSYAFVPRLTPALTIQGPFSLEAWANMASDGYTVEIGEGGGTGLNGSPNFGGFQFGQGIQTVGNQFQMNYFTGSGNFQNEEQETNLLFTTGKWYHYVVTYDGANSTLYVNGQDVWAATSSMAADTWSPLAIGGGKWDGGPICGIRWFNGSLDEVAIYSNVLSALQVTNHYLAGTSAGSNYFQTITNDHPLLYYRMDNLGFTSPPPTLYPVAANYGSSVISGFYPPGIVPGGLSGPPLAALGSNCVAAPINGVVSCVDAGYVPALNPTGTQPFTAMTWFRTYPADGRMQTIMSHGGSASWGINLSGLNGTAIWNSGAGEIVSTNILNDGNWHFVAGVYDGSKNYLYVDGALNNSGTATHGIVGNTTDDLLLGGDPDYTQVGANEQYLAGAIAEAAFFTNALTSIQVQSLYQAGITPPPPISLTIQNPGNGQLQLNWNYGTLQTATNVTGPYSDMTGTTSPYTLTPTNSQQYYRVRANP